MSREFVSIPKSFKEYLVDLLFDYLKSLSSKDIQNGIRFVNDDNEADLVKVEKALKKGIPSLHKTAIGRGTTDETAKDQFDLYKEVHPNTDMTWHDFKKDSEVKLKLYKPKPLSKTQERDRVSLAIRDHADQNKASLRSKLRKSINRTSRKLEGVFESLVAQEDPTKASMEAGAIAATLASNALNDVGLDGPLQAGGVALASGVVALHVYKYVNSSTDRPSEPGSWWRDLEESDMQEQSDARASVRRILHFSS
jgi:hypothetical protein